MNLPEGLLPRHEGEKVVSAEGRDRMRGSMPRFKGSMRGSQTLGNSLSANPAPLREIPLPSDFYGSCPRQWSEGGRDFSDLGSSPGNNHTRSGETSSSPDQ